MGTTQLTITGALYTDRGRVVFASYNARTGGVTLVSILTHGGHNGQVVAALVRRPSILRATGQLRGLNFRIVCLGPSRGKIVGLSSLGTTLGSGALLMDVVLIGGRVNAVRPVDRTMELAGTLSPGTCFRYSTMRTCNGVPVGTGGLKISVLATDKRGVRKPGNVNFLCGSGGYRVTPFVANNNRRGNVHSKARYIPLVTKLRNTVSSLPGLRSRLLGAHRVCSCTGKLLGSVTIVGSFSDNLPCVLGVSLIKCGDRAILRFLREHRVFISDKDTYTGNGRDCILGRVKVDNGHVSSVLHVDFSESARGRSVSRLCTTLALTRGDVEGTWG